MRILRVISLIFLSCLFAQSALADTARLPRPDATPAEQKIVKKLLQQLETEARAIMKEQKLPIAKPDIAARFNEKIPLEIISVLLLHRLHNESFIDAYTRWQLTSYEPPLSELTDAQFLLFMDETPALLENPWADPGTVQLLEQIEEAGPLGESDAAALRRLKVDLKTKTDITRDLQRPAEQFREWIAAKLGEKGMRPRLWMLEECRAIINGGWPTRAIKTRITRDFTDSVVDDSFTQPQRQAVALAAEHLQQNKRHFVTEFGFRASGAVDVKYSTAQVSAKDVENWRDRLFGRVLK